MNKFQEIFIENKVINFLARSILYFFILLGLLYLYHYSGIDQGHFIYNEF